MISYIVFVTPPCIRSSPRLKLLLRDVKKPEPIFILKQKHITTNVVLMRGLVSQRSWVRYPVWPHTFVSPSADSRGAVVSYWRKYEHEVLVNCLGGLSLPRKSVVRLTDRPDMTLDVYLGRKTTTTQQT